MPKTRTGGARVLPREERDDFPFLEGRFFGATFLPVTDRNHTRLAGSRSEAQPPGAKNGGTKKSLPRRPRAVKTYSSHWGYFPHTTRGRIRLACHRSPAPVRLLP